MAQAWRVSARYVAGRPLDGTPRTDSTFFRPASRVLTYTGRTSRWAMLPGWKRAVWRVGTPAVAASATMAYITHPVITTVSAGSLAASGAGYTAWRIRRAWLRRQHFRTYLLPLHRVLRANLGDGGDHPDHWLFIPPNFDREDVESLIWLPKNLHMTAEVRRVIKDAVSQKLGLTDPDFSWRTIGPRPSVAIRPAPKPPTKTVWGAIAEAARKAPDTAPVLGIGPRGTIVDADLEAESPHILISAGSGGGKSVLIRAILAQALNRGAGAIILDYKRHSHRWANGLPGVTYARDIAEIHDALVQLGAEGERRNRAADATGECDDPRIFLVAEELNATMGKLARYWSEIRDRTDPKTSPAINALADVMFMGRAVRIHVLAVAQLMTARTLGGPEVRENFATRCLTRCSNNALKMLVPEVMPIRKPTGVGRWLVVKNGVPYETQVTYMSDQEAREWAMAGVANPAAVLTVPPSHSRSDVGGRPETVSVPLPFARPQEELLVTLADAMHALPGRPLTLANIRKLAQRDRARGRFPEPVGQDGPAALYRLADLIEWKKRRDAVTVVDGKVA